MRGVVGYFAGENVPGDAPTEARHVRRNETLGGNVKSGELVSYRR